MLLVKGTGNLLPPESIHVLSSPLTEDFWVEPSHSQLNLIFSFKSFGLQTPFFSEF